jgi:predicted DCC family thiol-disulfide oxidoreductase YuxK
MKNISDIKGTMQKTTLIYDAGCPVCVKSVRWIERSDVHHSFEMVPCGSDAVETRFPGVERAACERAIQLVLPDGAVVSGEKAFPEIFKRLRGYRFLAGLLRVPGAKRVSRTLYRWFADRRYKISAFLHISLPKK